MPAIPSRRSRNRPNARATVLTKGERDEILAAIPDREFRDFVFALQESGARPSEVLRVTSENVDLKLGVWVFADHKTVNKTGKPRIVYLTPALFDLTKELMEKHPAGPLFRSRRTKQAFTYNAIRCRFRNLRKKLPQLNGVIAYAYRHTFCTEALINGVGIAQVAELLGHTSTEMVSKHYQHVAERVDHLHEAACKATQGERA